MLSKSDVKILAAVFRVVIFHISRIVSETIAMEDQYELVYALYRMLSSPMTLDDLHIHHCNIELVNALLTHVVSLFVLEVYVFIRAV